MHVLQRLFALCLTLSLFACSQIPDRPSALPAPAADLFDSAAPDLGLPRLEAARTVTVFQPAPGTDQFSNGAVPIAFKGRLFVQWQSSARDEDAPDTWVAYAVSADNGDSWTRPRALTRPSGDAEMRSSGGWWTDGETLVAYINVWPEGFRTRTGGYTEYRLSRDGETWTDPQPVRSADGTPVNGVIEQDPHFHDGRLHTAFHLRPGIRVHPHYTDDTLGLTGWLPGAFENLPADPPMSRELEPSLFARGDCLVMVFRDQASSFRQLASQSCNRGESWSRPELTTMPDARTKQSAGNLPDGTAYLVHSPNAGKTRIPLALSLSRDGMVFDRSHLLRGEADLQPLRQAGLYKRAGYHYPKSVVANGHLYIAYTANKEDVELTRIPLSALELR